MKKWIWIYLLIASLVFTACGSEEKETETVSEEVEIKNIEITDENTYTFVDVYGQEYEAELLENVPYSTYDEERLIEKDGFKYYTDENGNITSTLGIDVSKYQGNIDYQKVKEAGIEFVIIRLGYRGYGESGALVEDDSFKTNIEGALDAGLEVGVYFFSQAINEEETLQEAQFVLERIKDYDVTYPVVFDTEEIKDDEARTDGLSKEQFTQNCITFCDAIEEAGYETMIYANMKWMAFTLDLTKLTEYDKWYADYEMHPQCPYEIDMWQYTETGSVPGVEGNVDINVCF